MDESSEPKQVDQKPLREQIEKQGGRKTCMVDLRVHNPSSVSYVGVEGIDPARALVSLARVKGIDIMAVSDFYSVDFIDRLQLTRGDQAIVIIPGVDVRCRFGACDDIVLSCLFPEHVGSIILSEFLRQLGVPRSATGDGRYIVGHPIDTIIAATEERGGVILPIRVDKTPHRAQAIPGLVELHGFRAFDLAYAESARYFASRWPAETFHLFNFSNAFALAQVGTRSLRLKLSSPDFEGIRQLLQRYEPGEVAEATEIGIPVKRS